MSDNPKVAFRPSPRSVAPRYAVLLIQGPGEVPRAPRATCARVVAAVPQVVTADGSAVTHVQNCSDDLLPLSICPHGYMVGLKGGEGQLDRRQEEAAN